MKSRSPFAALLAPCILLVAASTARAQFEWSPVVPYPDEQRTVRIASGDLNADGNADIVRVAWTSFQISAFLGDGRGGLTARGTKTFLLEPQTIRLFDADQDGDDDVLLAGALLSELALIVSDGAGGLPTPLRSSLGGYATDVDIADMDGDGLLDAVSVLPGSPVTGGPSGVAIWHGSATAPYLSRFVFRATTTNPSHVSLADFDLDGRPDIALGEESSVSILLSDGTGGFIPSATIPGLAIGRKGDMVAGDVAGDASPEIVVSHRVSGAGVTSVFADTPAGGYTELLLPRAGDGATWTAAAIGDVDRDGSTDFICPSPRRTVLHLADGASGFTSISSDALGGKTGALADLDGDSYPDFLGRDGVAFNRCHEARRGNVNAGAGPIVDVLLVNGLPGEGRERWVSIDRLAPFTLVVEPSPTRPAGPSRFALYAWRGATPTSRTEPRAHESGIGRAILPTPLTGGEPQPDIVLNNIRGSEARLGFPTRPSRPAPFVVASRPLGLRRGMTFFLQGLIRDDGAPNGVAAMTNAIQVIVR